MRAEEIRKKYLEFFQSKEHVIVPSASLLPENDPTTLFTGSGMQPMVPYLLGEKHPQGARIVDSQKCFRSGDIDDVGDNRHTTFFEMLGNWSLGDYFKKDQIEWMFVFLTKELGLDPKRIYVSVYRGNKTLGIPKDDEAVGYWQEQFKSFGIDAKAVDFAEKNGMQDGKIFYYNEKENWWSRAGVPEKMPIGEPGGADSEMFWDFGAHLKLHENSQWKDQPCHVACDCGRYMEIGNNVFMQYIRTEEGFEELKNKNIDFGGGLERIAVAINDTPDIFLSDIFESLRQKIEEVSKKKYGANENETKAFRVIMDHLRGATFLIADGATPSNKDQGYFTRRLIRRAVRFAYDLGVDYNFTKDVANVVIDEYASYYKDLENKRGLILNEMDKEEDKFRKTLVVGLNRLKKFISNPEGNFWYSEDGTKKSDAYFNDETVDMIFDLYQTYGFPLELVCEELKKEGIHINEEKLKEKFRDRLKKHQELSRTASAGKFKGGLADSSEQTLQLHTVAHLMLAGLRKVLGDHVHQKGSNITAERVRFDFSHPEKMTDEQKKVVEDYVNGAIQSKMPVVMTEMSLDDAKASGAEGAFENKYGDVVKVYEIKGFSNEICGGPHVTNTGDIKGAFRIKKEESSSAGVRRIKAVIE
jgi:alanyl-tRNA synthetase